MIKNYQKYLDELKKISIKQNDIRIQEIKLNQQQQELEQQLYLDAHEYILSEFSKKLKPIEYENIVYFMLSDEVGIKLNKITNYSHSIDCRVMYYKPDYNKKKFKLGNTVFSWSYRDHKTIDQFIDHVIAELEKIKNTREKAEITRMAKKYNL